MGGYGDVYREPYPASVCESGDQLRSNSEWSHGLHRLRADGDQLQCRREHSERDHVLSLLNPAAGVYAGNIDQWYPYGTQFYNGLLSSIQKRLSQGTSISGNWTWSHCTGVYRINSKPEETATNPYNPLRATGEIATATGVK